MGSAGEMPIEPGDSWFSPKCIEVQPRMFASGGRALNGLGALTGLPNSIKLRMPYTKLIRSQTTGAKIRGRKGNSPDHQLRSQSDV